MNSLSYVLRYVVATVLLSVTAFGTQASSVTLDDLGNWQVLEFRGIPANTVSVSDSGMLIEVAKSASPLVYPLASAETVSRVRIRGSWEGALNLPADGVQGSEGLDDFVLKVGLVESGDKRLTWLQKRFAPKWLRTLFDLAPKDGGVSRIHFLSTTQQSELVGNSRQHPLSELLYETRYQHLDQPGEFDFVAELDNPAEVVALWISVDGDDTGSTYSVNLEAIELLNE